MIICREATSFKNGRFSKSSNAPLASAPVSILSLPDSMVATRTPLDRIFIIGIWIETVLYGTYLNAAKRRPTNTFIGMKCVQFLLSLLSTLV